MGENIKNLVLNIDLLSSNQSINKWNFFRLIPKAHLHATEDKHEMSSLLFTAFNLFLF